MRIKIAIIIMIWVKSKNAKVRQRFYEKNALLCSVSLSLRSALLCVLSAVCALLSALLCPLCIYVIYDGICVVYFIIYFICGIYICGIYSICIPYTIVYRLLHPYSRIGADQRSDHLKIVITNRRLITRAVYSLTILFVGS